jgi:hypothetical protein
MRLTAVRITTGKLVPYTCTPGLSLLGGSGGARRFVRRDGNTLGVPL